MRKRKQKTPNLQTISNVLKTHYQSPLTEYLNKDNMNPVMYHPNQLFVHQSGENKDAREVVDSPLESSVDAEEVENIVKEMTNAQA